MRVRHPFELAHQAPQRSSFDPTLPWAGSTLDKLPGPALVHGITGWTASTNYYSGAGAAGELGVSAFTSVLLMRRTGALNSGGIPASKTALSGTGHAWRYPSGTTVGFRAYIGGAAVDAGAVTPDADKWYLFVATFETGSPGALTFYSQGVQTASTSAGSSTTHNVDSTRPTTLGGRGAGIAAPANTVIGAYAVGNAALTASEVAALFQRVRIQNHLPAIRGETARWDVWSKGQGAPATWADQVAALGLTRTGSLTQSTYSTDWGT